jgi:putative membrane-bound dehydrogenase-like protein
MPYMIRRRLSRFVGVCALILFAAQAALAQLPPAEELKALQVPPGFDISLFASEPMITNPAAIDVDTKGRVWVAEIEWYRSKAKNPPADKIKVLEDTDGDGKADKVTVFAEGVFAPMSICVAGDKVYVATSPDLWVYEDKNGDLKADGPPKKLLTGFGGTNHDHGAHSLVLGPDHKWWMSHGDTGFKVTGTDESKIEFRWGAMLRGELDGSKLETVAVNFRNPYEICVDSFGNSFCSDNDNDGNFSVRICWIMEGGDYGWFGGPPGPRGSVPTSIPFSEHWHFRGHVPGYVPATLVTGFGSPCGICFYEGDAFGSQYKNAPLHADAGPREVRIYRHVKEGSGMKATSQVFLSSKGDNYFRPDDVCTAPDGSLYVSDWYDGGVGGHAYNNPNQGRIFLLKPKDKKLTRTGTPGPYADIASAIEGLKSPNLATQYLARERLLAEGAKSVPALTELLKSDEPNFRARSLWLLDRIGGGARKVVVDQLKSSDSAFRALAVRILRRHGDEYADAILAQASDPAEEVRLEVLLTLPKLTGDKPLATLVQLAAKYDGSDRYLLEAINIAANGRKPQLLAALKQAGQLTIDRVQLLQLLDPSAAAELLTHSLASGKLDDAARAKVLAQLAVLPTAEAATAALKVAVDRQASRDLRAMALNLLSTNLGNSWKGVRDSTELASGLRQLLVEPDWRMAALTLIGDNGLNLLGPEVLGLAQSPDIVQNVRERAIQVAAQIRAAKARETFEQLLATGGPIGKSAFAGIVDLQDWAAVKKVLLADGSSAGSVSADFQTDAVNRLMSTTAGALVLLRWVDDKSLPENLRKSVIAKATKHPDANVRVLYERFIPEDQRPQRLGSAIKAADILALAGNEQRGQQIFFQSSAAQCKNCHRINGNGAQTGPDLSQIGKKYERATLLETILDPSKAIAPEFIAYLVETEAGQIYLGFVVQKNDSVVVLKDANNKLIRVPAKDIVSMIAQPKSLMPELVLRDVTAQDAADLLAYLASLKEPPSGQGK